MEALLGNPLEFNWWLFLAVVAGNFLWMAIMGLAQELDPKLPPRHSRVEGTNQKFKYMQDFWSMIYGDIIAIPLIANAFLHVVMSGLVSDAEWVVFFVIAVVDILGFMWICMRAVHLNDQGAMDGWMRWNGVAHLPYHGAGMAIAILSIWHIFVIDGVFSLGHFLSGELNGWPLYVGLVGGAIYVIFFVVDMKVGNFDQRKPVKQIDR